MDFKILVKINMRVHAVIHCAAAIPLIHHDTGMWSKTKFKLATKVLVSGKKDPTMKIALAEDSTVF